MEKRRDILEKSQYPNISCSMIFWAFFHPIKQLNIEIGFLNLLSYGVESNLLMEAR
jgi:hypothetical protein